MGHSTLSFRVVNLQVKPVQKVNHHKMITEQKHQLDRLKLENLELQTSSKANLEKIRMLEEALVQ